VFEEEDKECNRKLQVMEQCMNHALLKYLNINLESASDVKSQPSD